MNVPRAINHIEHAITRLQRAKHRLSGGNIDKGALSIRTAKTFTEFALINLEQNPNHFRDVAEMVETEEQP